MFQPVRFVALALALAGGILTAHCMGIREFTRADDCSGYMFSKCELDLDGVIATLESENPEICQMICAEVYQGECNVFYFNHNDTSCSVLTQNVEDHIRTCRQVGGTRTPSVEQCFSQTDPCYFFHDEACTTTSNVIANLQNVESAARCQRSCELDSKCLYFLYDVDIKRCQLLDGVEKICSVTVGPSAPSYQECKTPPYPEQCTTQVYRKSNGQYACGFYLAAGMTWHQAQDECAKQGARLPEIRSAEENADIFALKPVDSRIWLGGTDAANEGTFVWQSSGLPLEFINWTPSEPDNLQEQDCMTMWLDIGQWDDLWCDDASVATLCEVVYG